MATIKQLRIIDAFCMGCLDALFLFLGSVCCTWFSCCQKIRPASYTILQMN